MTAFGHLTLLGRPLGIWNDWNDMMATMDYAELYQKEWAEFQAQTRRSRGLKAPDPESTLERWARNVVRFFRRTPGQPEDPYAYAMAPKKPRLPRRGASVAAEPPL